MERQQPVAMIYLDGADDDTPALPRRRTAGRRPAQASSYQRSALDECEEPGCTGCPGHHPQRPLPGGADSNPAAEWQESESEPVPD
eukprot:2529952-Rhodomonas_salina.1